MHRALRDSRPKPVPQAHVEVLSRLASVRHALRLVDPYGGGPAPDPETDEAIAAAWELADETKRRRFDVRSGLLVGATVAGIGALMDERREGAEPNSEASRALVEQIRRELQDVAGIMLD